MTSVRTDYTTYTDEGHLVGMLDRDLRTAKIRYTCQRPQVFYAGEERSRGGVTTPARIPMDVTPLRSRKLRKSHYSWKNAQSKSNREVSDAIGGALCNRWPMATWEADGDVTVNVTHLFSAPWFTCPIERDWCIGIFNESTVSIRATGGIPGIRGYAKRRQEL